MKNLKIVSLAMFFFNFITFSDCNFHEEYALVIEPVVETVGQKLIDPNYYSKLPLSPINKKDPYTCPRFHQLLFNEVVKVVDKQDDEYIIEIPSIFFQKNGDLTKNNKCRIAKKKIRLFSYLKKFKIDFNKIPKPIDFEKPMQIYDKTITLTGPFKDTKTSKIYSAGTRFIYESEDQDYYKVYIFNPINNHFIISRILKKICISNQQTNNQKKIDNFVRLLKKWANLKKGFIPYVWGGCSLCYLQNSDEFIEVHKKMYNKNINYYEYPKSNNIPKTGFDCSGIILRVAQICGLPYYFKNSITASQNIKNIEQKDNISNGDIIWIPGHVIVVSDTKKNLIIEATDYSTGYGKVHEIPLSQLFKDVKTFKDLKKHYFEKINLKRLNKKGEIFQDISNFKILRLSSLFD